MIDEKKKISEEKLEQVQGGSVTGALAATHADFACLQCKRSYTIKPAQCPHCGGAVETSKVFM